MSQTRTPINQSIILAAVKDLISIKLSSLYSKMPGSAERNLNCSGTAMVAPILTFMLIVLLSTCTSANAQQCQGQAATTPVTVNDETSNIPSSRQLVNGTSTVVDTSTSGKIKVNVSLPNSGVTAGTYTNANIGVNAQGLVTSASNGSGGGGGGSNALTAGNLGATVPNVIVPTNGLLQPLPFDHTLTPASAGVEYVVPTSSSTPLGSAAGPDGNVWFTESAQNKIGKLTPTGTFTEYTVTTSGSTPTGICAGPDGNLWFTENAGNNIGKITTAGSITEYAIPTSSSAPIGICAGPDGNIWFTENSGNKIGLVTPSGSFTEYTVTTSGSQPRGICAGPDGNLWFAESNGNKIGKITPTGTITEYSVITSSSSPYNICTGADGNLWFTEYAGNNIGKITTAGTTVEFAVPTSSSQPYGICAGPDGNLWFSENSTSKIAVMTTRGTFIEYTLPTGGAGASIICVGPDGNLWVTEQSTNKVASWQFNTSGTTPILNSIIAGTNVQISRTTTGLSIASNNSGRCQRQWTPADINNQVSLIGIQTLSNSTGVPHTSQTGTNGTVYSLTTLTTGATSGNSIAQYGPTSADLIVYASEPVMTTTVSVNRTTNCRVWIAVVPHADTISSTDTPGPDVLAFRYSTGAGDTHWNTYTSSHTNVNSAVDTGVSITANQPDVLTIDWSNPSSVKFYINGTLVDTRTTNLPSTSATSQPYVGFTTLTGSALSGYNGLMTLTHN